MGIEELEKLTAEGLKLGLQREALRKWVEAERDKLRAKRETERAERAKLRAQLDDLRAAAQEKQIAELEARVALLQRQWVDVCGQAASPTTYNGGADPKPSKKIDAKYMPLHSEKRQVFPELEPNEEKLAYHIDTSVCEPYREIDTLQPQVLPEGALAGGSDDPEISPSLVTVAIECKEASKSDCPELQSIGALKEPVLPVEIKNARKHRRKQGKAKISCSRSTMNLRSAIVKCSRKKCLTRNLRMQVQIKGSLVKLREISSAEPVLKLLARRVSFTSGQGKASRRRICCFAFSLPSSKTDCKKQRQTASRTRSCKLRGCPNKLEAPGSRKYLCRKTFHGQRCWKYKRKDK